MLHLIQEYCGRETAVKIAKIYAIDMDRNQQIYFSTTSQILGDLSYSLLRRDGLTTACLAIGEFPTRLR
jgi:transcriptional regulator GlxA family with amidase domain